MGGYNSGRSGGRPTADMSRRIDIAWMIRKGLASPGSSISGLISWRVGDHPSGSVSYTADMTDLDNAELRLSYRRGESQSGKHITQTIRLTHTKPHFGGYRWWMICPYRYNRCGKLYLPNRGDRFAGRLAWRLGYHSQRVAHNQRPFEKLFRLQRKLASAQGWGAGLMRPKGMWRKTFERHCEKFDQHSEACDLEMAGVLAAFFERHH
jgi:hypothetical protein